LLFNSFTYLAFLIIVVPLYYLVPKKFKTSFLLLCSYLFYAYWDWRFCSLVALATIVVYVCGKLIYKYRDTSKKKLYLIVALVINLGILGVFKYYNFFIDSFNGAFSGLGMNLDKLHMTLILPIGISFYTFQSLTYTFGIYYDEMEPSDSFLNVALFVSFFPQLFAGPIERAKNILPQLKNLPSFNINMFKEGLVLITLGMFKKVLIGDTCGKIVNQIFAEPQYYASIELIMGIILYFVQIYADFSGYTNMARGTAKLLGINIMENFEQPYLSKSMAEFWRRWHISLSSWLRDYLFTPFSIATRNWGKFSVVLGLILTFTIVGLWHGAGWTYVFWGFFHGFLISFGFITQKSRASLYKKLGFYKTKLHGIAQVLITIFFVLISFIFFRSETFGEAFYIMKHIVQWQPGDYTIRVILIMISYLFVSFSLDFLEIHYKDHAFLAKIQPAYMYGICLTLWGVMFAYMMQSIPIPFVYFQF